ncbi:MAG: hypothetical protein PGN13_05085 [Patulibacter minatonensis]
MIAVDVSALIVANSARAGRRQSVSAIAPSATPHSATRPPWPGIAKNAA